MGAGSRERGAGRRGTGNGERGTGGTRDVIRIPPSVARWRSDWRLLALSALPPSRLCRPGQRHRHRSRSDGTVDSLQAGGLPAEVLNELLATFRDTTVLRLNGPLTVPAGSSDVRAGGGLPRRGRRRRHDRWPADRRQRRSHRAAGRPDHRPGPGGRRQIHRGFRLQRVALPARVYWDAAPVVRQSDGTLALREPHRTLGELAQAQATFNYGRLKTTLYLGTNTTYNRSEGLGIVLGPELRVPRLRLGGRPARACAPSSAPPPT